MPDHSEDFLMVLLSQARAPVSRKKTTNTYHNAHTRAYIQYVTQVTTGEGLDHSTVVLMFVNLHITPDTTDLCVFLAKAVRP